MSTHDLNFLYAQKNTVAENMRKYGGCFAQALGVALSYADNWNVLKIKLSWPDLWEKYLNFDKQHVPDNERNIILPSCEPWKG